MQPQNIWKAVKERNRKRPGEEKGWQIWGTIIGKIRMAEMYTSKGEEVQDKAREVSRKESCRTLEAILNNLYFIQKEKGAIEGFDQKIECHIKNYRDR